MYLRSPPFSTLRTKTKYYKPSSAPKQEIENFNDTTKVQRVSKIVEETQYSIARKFELSEAVKHLKECDPKLGSHLTEKAIANFQERLERADGANPFRSLSKMIVYQQIHGKAAASIYAKLLKLFDRETDDTFPTPLEMLAVPKEKLRTAGLSARKTEYILDLADKFNTHYITPERFHTMSDQEISKQLCAVKGIGQWTADMFLMFDLHHPDVLPVGDLAIRKGVANHFGLQNVKKAKTFPTAEQMEELTLLWKPYRSLASWLLWRISDIKVAD
ncbi:DNA glycosylase [Sporodiniella umbellata]|nr:DNA glycosylase [Sporodiniella umbellata]